MQDIILSIIALIITLLLTFISTKVSVFINEKVKTEKNQKAFQNLNLLVISTVKSTYQTYVESLKKDGLFDSNAQKEALNFIKDKILSQLSEDMKEYLFTNLIDLDEWTKTIIESTIYDLKK